MRYLNIAVVLLVLLTGGQAHAQADDTPALAPLARVRESFAQTFNGRPLQVCESEWESWSRMHGVCHDLVTATLPEQELIAGRVTEFVVYDGTLYQRVNDETQWTATRDPERDPDRTLNEAFFQVAYDATLTEIGAATIDGVPATQYQFWSQDATLNAEVGGQAVFDLFVSQNGYVVKNQFSARGEVPGLGAGEWAQVWVYRDWNAPITVAAPPREVVR